MKIKHEVNFTDHSHALVIRTRIQMAVKTVPEAGIRVSFRNPGDVRFANAVAFGVEWVAQRYALGGNRPGIEATVFFVAHEHLGPSAAIVALLAALCACDALGLPDEPRPRFDEHQRTVIFSSVTLRVVRLAAGGGPNRNLGRGS
jgi:hypothetical protein